MAHTGVQLEVEDWVRREWLPQEFGQRFSRERLKLTPGGFFDFDAVSADEKIVASISTSAARTATGNHERHASLKSNRSHNDNNRGPNLHLYSREHYAGNSGRSGYGVGEHETIQQKRGDE